MRGFYARFECRGADIHYVFGGREGRLRQGDQPQKREFRLLRFDQQITHESFAKFSERVTHTLTNFPIAEIDKTIKVNSRTSACH